MSTSKCPFAFIGGIPGKGFHSERIFGYSLNDILGTIIFALVTSYIYDIAIWKSILAWFIIAEVCHYAFGVQTAGLTTLGIDACPY
jgi:hypothetical protein